MKIYFVWIALGLIFGTVQAQAFPPQAIGYYSKGTLSAPSDLPLQGKGFIELFPGRNRYYGAQALVDLIVGTAGKMAELYPGLERLQIADLSASHGGKINPHNSHQNGLDFDAVYYRVDHLEQDPSHTEGLEEIFVKEGRISPNFDITRNWALMKAFASSGRVERVFVDGVIKQTLCNEAQRLGEFQQQEATLRILRPLEQHDNHLHLRIRCPEGNPQCIAQEEVGGDSGCQSLNPNDIPPTIPFKSSSEL
ncbi:penicillin-insensitive murein endopeptidase [Bdellovibrionota bacterium FG-2]